MNLMEYREYIKYLGIEYLKYFLMSNYYSRKCPASADTIRYVLPICKSSKRNFEIVSSLFNHGYNKETIKYLKIPLLKNNKK